MLNDAMPPATNVGGCAEKKYKDINGLVFDVSAHDWRQSKAC